MTFDTEFSIGQKLIENGQLKSTLTHFQSICKKYPLSISCKHNYSILLFQNQLICEAKELLTEIIHFDPFQYLATYHLFLRAQAQNNFEEAKPNLHISLSCLYADKGKSSELFQFLELAVKYYPNNIIGYIYLALFNESKQKVQEAENVFSNALQFNFQNPYIYIERASFNWRRGKIREAYDLKVYYKLENLNLFCPLSFKSDYIEKEQYSQMKSLGMQFQIPQKIQTPHAQGRRNSLKIVYVSNDKQNIQNFHESGQEKKSFQKQADNILPQSLEIEENFFTVEIQRIVKDIEIQKNNARGIIEEFIAKQSDILIAFQFSLEVDFD